MAWSRHRYVYDEIRARVADGEAESDVITALDERLVALSRAPEAGKRGRKPAKANWQGLVKELARLRPRPKARCEQGDDEEMDDCPVSI